MSAAQHLKSVVTLGGAVDASFTSMASEVDKQLGGATKQVKTLEREQKSLTKQIKKAKLAGADVSLLTRRYDALGKEIDEATTSARGFEAASDLKKSLKSTVGAVAATTVGLAGLSATVVGLTSVTNAATSEQAGFAKAYGMSIEQFNAWGGIALQAGLNAENTGDLVEELTNKFGEFKALGKQSSVSDVFGALGIDEAMMEGLNAAEQFEFVMSRLEKVGDTQQAASLADMLFGGEGNKIVTYIKNSGQSLDKLLDSQKAINNLTQEGADGALKYNTALNSVTRAMYSAWQDVAGVVGGEVAPVFDELSLTVSAFAREHREEITSFLKSAVEGSIAFASGVFQIAGAVNDVVQTFGGWETVAGAVAGIMAGKMVLGIAGVISNVRTMITALGTVKSVMLGVNAVMVANPIGAVALAVGVLTAAVVANWDTIMSWIDDIKGAFSEFMDWLGLGDDKPSSNPTHSVVTTAESSATTAAKNRGYYGTQAPTSDYNPYNYASRAQAANDQTYASSGARAVNQTVENITVVAAPGQSPEDIGKAVNRELGGHQNAMFDISSGD
ncbi:phage tail protein [Vibrio diazotrophicus]|uniref:Phage tail protein n=1 Tax=Vibrio diazotrophicus TaxID=685 RepID=A0ABX4W8A8_VIBDI|nr:phage tail protein [Vibrio diazotrophicus]PNH99225.1 phage tail protein [Vibrio diazotrophicus]